MKQLIQTLLLFLPLSALAHGPTPQKAHETVNIEAPAAKVWEVIKHFDAMADWHSDVQASAGDGTDQLGSVRRLTLENGELEESLDYYSDKDFEYGYRLKTENLKALPVSFYTASLQVVGDADSASVQWKSRFYRGDTGNFPPELLNDAAAVKAMQQFMRNGLNSLKNKCEQPH